MLEDKNMFDIPSSQVGKLTSDLTMYSIPFSMVTTAFVSYLYEIWGRRTTLVVSYLLTALIYFAIPYSAPDYSALMFLRCLIAITMSAPIAHPLVADYVKRTSRGTAVALAGVGIVLGEVFSMGILFNLTKSMSYTKAFAIAASLILMFTFVFAFTIREPDFLRMREQKGSRHLLVRQQLVRQEFSEGAPSSRRRALSATDVRSRPLELTSTEPD